MMQWLEKETSERFLNIIGSINLHAQRLYGTDLVLADYPARPGTLDTLDALWDAVNDVTPAAEALEGEKKEYLTGILDGIKMILRVMQGDDVPYGEQIAAMQQVESRLITKEQIAALTDILDRQLRELGYRQATAAEKTMAFLADHALKPEEVVPTTKAFLRRCRDRAEAKVFPLPPACAVSDVQGVRNVVYNGNSAYLGDYQGKLSFNIDRPWSLPTFANVLCHEGYPGHHAFYSRWDVLYRAGELPAEAAYYVKNTPTNALFEGVPENALHFLEWDDLTADTPEVTDEEKRLFSAGRRILDLQRMYQQNGCHLVNLEGATKEAAVAYMMESGLFQRSEAEGACRFFTDATRRTYYPSYFYGRWMVFNAYRRFPKERRGEFFRLTYDRPHTTRTYIALMEKTLGRTWEPYETEGMLTQ